MENSNRFLDLDNKKVLCLAETNYQIINCLNIACHAKNARFDLYVNELYKNSRQMVERIKSLAVFDRVQMYNVNFNKVLKVFRFIFLKNYIFKIFETFDYDVVLFASREFNARCVVTYVKYYRPNIQLISYDEGLGTYTSLMENYTNSFEKLAIRLFYNDEANFITDKLLYEPNAYSGKAKGISLYRMPEVDQNVISKINYLFNYRGEMTIESKYIYFDQYFDDHNEITINVIKLLNKKTNNEIVIKKHPQTPDGIFSEGIVYQYPGVPYEIIAANDKNIEDKVLITSYSTAVWTPMLLFKKYPKIILLYPVFKVDRVNNVINDFVKLYKKNKVIIVNSYSELEKLNLN